MKPTTANVILFFWITFLVPLCAPAQTYPTKPIRMIITFPPGGSADLLARLLVPGLTEALGQTVIVDNRPGGRQIIGSEIVANSAPDGYTIFLQGVTHVINPGLVKKLPYDTLNDFAPITMVMDSPLMFVAHPSAGIANIQQLISRAKASPGKLNYSSSGPGTGGQMAVELLKYMAGINIVQVPYKGAGPSLIALIGGQVQLTCTSPLGALPHVRTGKLLPLAVTSKERSRAVPDVPTVAESGVPGYETTVWYALFAPAKTPKGIIQRLNAEMVKLLKSPGIVTQLHDQGSEPVGNQPEELQKYLKAEIDRWTKLIDAAKISAD